MPAKAEAALLTVIDGLGFNRQRSSEIIDLVWSKLPDQGREELEGIAEIRGRGRHWAKNMLYPVHSESVPANSSNAEATAWLNDLAVGTEKISEKLAQHVRELIVEIADAKRYVPWAAAAWNLAELRNSNISIPTKAAGIWAGFEDLNPAVQGNSETGHQQIGNLSLAPQLPLEITQSIESGEFFENAALNETITNAKARDSKINFCFLLSGVGGGDGRVHSAWNHLEAFCELVFARHAVAPSKVQMQAILDGRDSAIDGSTEKKNGSGDFIGQLKTLLGKYRAEESLAWVVGRSTSMDRDYREEAAKADFDLMVTALGREAINFDEMRSFVEQAHADGVSDQDIAPIIIQRADTSLPMIEPGDAFVDLNFRSDRQRSKIGSLVGAKDFLVENGKNSGRNWEASWLEHYLNLEVCAIAEYHPIFEEQFGVRVAFPTEPHADNFLARWTEAFSEDSYELITESVKSSHMGYFFRGRREEPVAGADEIRTVIPSHGQHDGVLADTDFYKHPGMRAREVTEAVINSLSINSAKLICCNIAAPDMIGHLLPTRYEEAKQAYRETADALVRMATIAVEQNRVIVITSDHGNIEDDTSAHSVNEVLTTFITPEGLQVSVSTQAFSGNLFDVAPSVISLLGGSLTSKSTLDGRFVGKALVAAE